MILKFKLIIITIFYIVVEGSKGPYISNRCSGIISNQLIICSIQYHRSQYKTFVTQNFNMWTENPLDVLKVCLCEISRWSHPFYSVFSVYTFPIFSIYFLFIRQCIQHIASIRLLFVLVFINVFMYIYILFLMDQVMYQFLNSALG